MSGHHYLKPSVKKSNFSQKEQLGVHLTICQLYTAGMPKVRFLELIWLFGSFSSTLCIVRIFVMYIKERGEKRSMGGVCW